MHGLTFGAACFVDDALEEPADGGVRKRPGIDAFGIFQDFAFAVGLVERKMLRLLKLADFDRALRSLFEQLYDFAVDIIDAAPPITEQTHGATSRRERPWRAASFKERTRAARAADASSMDFAFSISLTNAEPTTAASAKPPNKDTWPGREIPKPTAMGRLVTAWARRKSAGRSSGSESFAPVTPVREMR